MGKWEGKGCVRAEKEGGEIRKKMGRGWEKGDKVGKGNVWGGERRLGR